MKRAADTLRALAWLAAAVLLAELGYTVHKLRPRLEVTMDNLDRTIIVAGAAAGDVERGARAWETASTTQSSQTTQALLKLNGATAALSEFILKTDNSLNSKLMPALSATIEHQDKSLLEIQTGLNASLSSLTANSQALQQAITDADRVFADPDLKAAISNASASTAELDEALKNFTAIAVDGRQVADKARETYLKPVNLWWGLVKTLLPLAGSAAQVVK